MDHSLAIDDAPWVIMEPDGDALWVKFGGAWTVRHSASVFQQLTQVGKSITRGVLFDMTQIRYMDTVGAWLLYRTERDFRERGVPVEHVGCTPEQRSLMDQAEEHDQPCAVEPPDRPQFLRLVEDVGGGVITAFDKMRSALGFVGLVLESLISGALHPKRFRLTATISQMELVGVNALPIVGLISFLIGIVIAYQGAHQLRLFGAEIFTVDMVVFAVLREFGILLTAIMIAGRSGSAFTAEIGSMQLHQEIDAMNVMSISPIETLVLPRFVALVIMMPILTFYADIVGILGGLVISWAALDISPALFVERAQAAFTIENFSVGLIKAPIFGAIIALIGCHEGMQVKSSAESLGRHTTLSVVEAIFMIIVLDAFFAIFFTMIGI